MLCSTCGPCGCLSRVKTIIYFFLHVEPQCGIEPHWKQNCAPHLHVMWSHPSILSNTYLHFVHLVHFLFSFAIAIILLSCILSHFSSCEVCPHKIQICFVHLQQQSVTLVSITAFSFTIRRWCSCIDSFFLIPFFNICFTRDTLSSRLLVCHLLSNGRSNGSEQVLGWQSKQMSQSHPSVHLHDFCNLRCRQRSQKWLDL